MIDKKFHKYSTRLNLKGYILSDHISKSKNLFFIHFNTLRIFQVNMDISENGGGGGRFLHIENWDTVLDCKNSHRMPEKLPPHGRIGAHIN